MKNKTNYKLVAYILMDQELHTMPATRRSQTQGVCRVCPVFCFLKCKYVSEVPSIQIFVGITKYKDAFLA